MITVDMICQGAVCIDVDASRIEGRTTGGLALNVWDRATWIAPNPSGMGPMTRVILLNNVADRTEVLHASPNG